MDKKRDKRKANPASGAEDEKPATPLQTKAPGKEANASSVEIPGTGTVVKDDQGREAKRVVRS